MGGVHRTAVRGVRRSTVAGDAPTVLQDEA